MKERAAEQDKVAGAEWFTAWLPRTSITTEAPDTSERLRMTAIETIDTIEAIDTIDEVRTELQAVAGHLNDPSALGIEASLPHLERAVASFGRYVKIELPQTTPESGDGSLNALRTELALATALFENAYALQAGWAAQLGLNLDGTPKQLLYSRPGAPSESSLVGTGLTSSGWEG